MATSLDVIVESLDYFVRLKYKSTEIDLGRSKRGRA